MKHIISFITVTVLLAFMFNSCSDNENIINHSNLTDNNPVTWTVPGDFSTIAEAINSANVKNGDIINVGPGSFDGAFVTKKLSINGIGNTIINDGPAHSSGLIMGFRLMTGSDNSSFSHLTFTTDLAIMNGGAVNNIKISHCDFINSTQAISNWRGNGWIIEHNNITDLKCCNGGGIGILIGDYMGGIVKDNQISHNTISGTLHLQEGELGGYSGTGIVLYADFRWGRTGTNSIEKNFITHNTISLVSEDPDLVDVVAFEITDTRDDVTKIAISHNSIGFNDFRGTGYAISLTPEILDKPNNDISRNLGDNRGHGMHPGDFKP